MGNCEEMWLPSSPEAGSISSGAQHVHTCADQSSYIIWIFLYAYIYIYPRVCVHIYIHTHTHIDVSYHTHTPHAAYCLFTLAPFVRSSAIITLAWLVGKWLAARTEPGGEWLPLPRALPGARIQRANGYMLAKHMPVREHETCTTQWANSPTSLLTNSTSIGIHIYIYMYT